MSPPFKPGKRLYSDELIALQLKKVHEIGPVYEDVGRALKLGHMGYNSGWSGSVPLSPEESIFTGDAFEEISAMELGDVFLWRHEGMTAYKARKRVKQFAEHLDFNLEVSVYDVPPRHIKVIRASGTFPKETM